MKIIKHLMYNGKKITILSRNKEIFFKHTNKETNKTITVSYSELKEFMRRMDIGKFKEFGGHKFTKISKKELKIDCLLINMNDIKKELNYE